MSLYLKNQNLQIAFWKHHPIADQESESLINATLSFHQATQGDIVKLTPAGNYQIAERGGVAVWQNDYLGRRTFSNRAITHPDDWLNLSSELTTLELDVVFAAQQLRKKIDNNIPLLATVFSPITQALMLAGEDTLLTHLKAFPKQLDYAFNTLTHSTQQLISAYQDVGVTGIYFAAQHLSEKTIPRLLYKKSCLNYDSKVLDGCRNFELNILHIHGSNIHFELVPTHNNWMVHFEINSQNPKPEYFRTISHCPAVIGLPYETYYDRTTLINNINILLKRFNQNSALLSAECVIPLEIPTQHITSWIESIRHAN